MFFFLQIYKSQTKLGKAVKLSFQLTQHSRDDKLLRSLVPYLECGNYTRRASKPWGEFICTKFSDINLKIIPFFLKYPIQGVKYKDFEDFCKVANMMKAKAHLTQNGLNKIQKIKLGMNTGRKWS